MVDVKLKLATKGLRERAEKEFNIGAIKMWLMNHFGELKNGKYKTFERYIKPLNTTVTGYTERGNIVIEYLDKGDNVMYED